MKDWFDSRAELFLEDRAGCVDDPWTVKSRCAHCLAALLRDVAERGSLKVEPFFTLDAYQQGLGYWGPYKW